MWIYIHHSLSFYIAVFRGENFSSFLCFFWWCRRWSHIQGHPCSPEEPVVLLQCPTLGRHVPRWCFRSKFSAHSDFGVGWRTNKYEERMKTVWKHRRRRRNIKLTVCSFSHATDVAAHLCSGKVWRGRSADCWRAADLMTEVRLTFSELRTLQLEEIIRDYSIMLVSLMHGESHRVEKTRSCSMLWGLMSHSDWLPLIAWLGRNFDAKALIEPLNMTTWQVCKWLPSESSETSPDKQGREFDAKSSCGKSYCWPGQWGVNTTEFINLFKLKHAVVAEPHFQDIRFRVLWLPPSGGISENQ